jgi:hypothetical protein
MYVPFFYEKAEMYLYELSRNKSECSVMVADATRTHSHQLDHTAAADEARAACTSLSLTLVGVRLSAHNPALLHASTPHGAPRVDLILSFSFGTYLSIFHLTA